MNYPKNILVLILISSFIIFGSCGKDEDKKQDKVTLEDQIAMLNNTAEKIIIPRYQELSHKAGELHTVAGAFTSSPSISGLSNLQTAFKNCYTSWQYCSAFEFGPAMDMALRSNMNTFPCDTAEINSNISSGSYDLNQYTAVDQKGLPAVDFLIHDINGSNSNVVNKYTSAADASARKQYLLELTKRIKDNASEVLNEWDQNGGNYVSTFKKGAGSDAGSSMSLLVNQMNYDWEIIKNNKIGIPLGKKSLGTLYPEKTEGYYGQLSLDLAKSNIKAIHELYRCETSTKDHFGLQEYLIKVKAKSSTGDLLASTIDQQFSTAFEAAKEIPSPISDAVQNHQQKVESAYEEIQKQVVLMKTDMPSALGIRITYQDNDGD